MAYRRTYRRTGYNGARYRSTGVRAGRRSVAGGRRGGRRTSTRATARTRDVRIVIETHPTGQYQRPSALQVAKALPRKAKY